MEKINLFDDPFVEEEKESAVQEEKVEETTSEPTSEPTDDKEVAASKEESSEEAKADTEVKDETEKTEGTKPLKENISSITLHDSLFPDKPNKKEAKPSSTAAGTTAKKVAEKAEKAKDELNEPIGEPMIVRLYGRSMPIQDVSLTPEQIRKNLEKDFPELTKKRTVIELDKKKKLIIFTIKAAKKGLAASSFGFRKAGTFEEIAEIIKARRVPEVLIYDLHYNNTDYEVRVTEIGAFIATKDGMQGQYVRYLPKIPVDILNEAVTVFTDMAKHELEYLGQIFWDRNKKKYFIHYPRGQKVTKYTVDIERDTELEAEHLLVMDIHSHHKMPAKFSAIDDEDELETRLYAVVGEMRKLPSNPSICVRASCAGKFIPLHPSDIFQYNGEFPYNINIYSGSRLIKPANSLRGVKQ